MEEIRIDKYLWAIRVFKTRTDATDACKGGKVKVGTVNAKPSRAVAPGEIITVRKGVATFTYRVIQLVDHRLGAKLVPDYAENLTPEEELNKLKAGELKDGKIPTLTIVIKPTDNASYKNMVDALDEMQILSIGTYVIDKLTPDDEKLLKDKGIEM